MIRIPRRVLTCLLFGITLSWADVTQLRHVFESILNQSAPLKFDELASLLGPETIDVLSADDIKSLLPLAKQCLHSAQLEVRRDGLFLLLAVALRPDSSELLEPYIDDIDTIISDVSTPLRQGAATVLTITRPKASPKVIATLTAHLDDKDNSVMFPVAAFLLKASDDPVLVHKVLSVVQKRSDPEVTSGILGQLGLIRTRNLEALSFIGTNLDSANPSDRRAAVEAVSRLHREVRARFAAQLGRIAADHTEPQEVRAKASEAIR